MSGNQADSKKKNNTARKGNGENGVLLSWAEIKHHRHFEHIVALGSRVDMLVTANSILIAGLLLMLFGSTKSETIRSQVRPLVQILSFVLLGLSLLFCIVSTFLRVKPESDKGRVTKRGLWNLVTKLPKLIINITKNILVLSEKSKDFFNIEPKDIHGLVFQINEYSTQAKKAIAYRHRLMNLSAIMTILGLFTIAYMIIILIFDP